MIQMIFDAGVAQLVVSVAGMIIGGAITWGAIRADIRHIHRELSQLRAAADRAHERIDDILCNKVERRA